MLILVVNCTVDGCRLRHFGSDVFIMEAGPSLPAGCKVYIGNLSSRASECHVLKLAKPFGAIEKLDLVCGLNRCGQRVPRGFAFVTFRDASAARKAVSALDGVTLLGRQIRVSVAKPSNHELRRLLGEEGRKGRKRTLEEARRSEEEEEEEQRKVTAGPSNEDKIRALEAKLKTMEEEQFRLAIPEKKPSYSKKQ